MPSILHLSDVHFGPPHRPAASAAAQRLVSERSPTLVVISGDLTQRAKPYQFRQARSFTETLGVPVLAVPGNHDVPMYRFWERMFAPFGAYRKYFCRELEPVFESDELLVVGANSAFRWTIKHGRLLPHQLERLRRVFFEAPGDGRCRVLVCHHPLVTVPGFEDPAARRASDLLPILADGGVDLVLSGHLHQLFNTDARDRYPDLSRSVHLFQSGTSTSFRGRGTEKGISTAHWFDVEANEIRVTALRYEDAHRSFETLWQKTLERSVPLAAAGT